MAERKIDQDRADEQPVARVAPAAVAPVAPEVPEGPPPSETIPGGRYINTDGHYVNADGKYITFDGKVVDEPVKARK